MSNSAPRSSVCLRMRGSRETQPSRNYFWDRYWQRTGHITGNPGSLFVSRTGFITWVNIWGEVATTLCRKDKANYFFSKLRMHIKDNNNSPHGKFHRFLLQFSRKFPDLNFAPYVLLLLVSSTEKKFTEHTSTGVSRDNDSSVSGRSNT